MKLAIFTDVHANLPALEATLAAIDKLGCDLIVHTGDAIGIGPHPAECLERLLGLKNGRFIMGNHDAYFAFGLPQPQPKWMSNGEISHQQWTHAQLNDTWRKAVRKWPFNWVEDFEGIKVAFAHYGLDQTGRDFASLVRPPTAAALDDMFASYGCDLVFYGHDHRASDLTGNARFINPGSLGCQTEAVARFVTLVCENGRYSLTAHAIVYDDTTVRDDLKARQVPDRDLICRAFYGDRWKL